MCTSTSHTLDVRGRRRKNRATVGTSETLPIPGALSTGSKLLLAVLTGSRAAANFTENMSWSGVHRRMGQPSMRQHEMLGSWAEEEKWFLLTSAASDDG